MFANCQLGGMNMAAPDVCKTPAPPPPVGPGMLPIPYPNMAMGMTAIPNCLKVLISAMPAHNLMTSIPISNGDNPGVLGGVASQIFMGPSKHIMGSFGVLYCGMPATKLTSPTGQNGMPPNAMGMTIVPSQFKVMIMK
jgi:hypothetical protein